MQCFGSPFEEDSFNIDLKILSCNLNRVNIVLYVILFLKFVFSWLDRVFPQDRKPNLFHKILATLLSIPFCFFWGLPSLLLISFFFTCKYYPYTTFVLLSFFFLPWIFSKLASFRCEVMDPPDRQPSGQFEITYQSIVQGLQRAGDFLQPWQIQSLQVSDSPPGTPSSAHLNSVGDTPLSSENQAHQLQRPYFLQPWQIQPLQISDSPPGTPSSAHLNSVGDTPLPSNNPLQPLYFSTESLEDVPQVTVNDISLGCSSTSTTNYASVTSTSSTNDASVPSTSSMNDAAVPSTSSKNGATVPRTSSTTSIRKKRRKTRVVNFHKPKKRKKKPTTQAD